MTQDPFRSDRLELETLPRGKVSRLLIALAHDGLGFPVEVPVMVARGAKDGPTFGLTAAVHGNELNGIPVIHRLLSGLRLNALRGAVVAVPVVNIWGFHRRQREFSEGTDLNHKFPGKAKGTEPEQYARRLIKRVVRQFDFLVDLHTASFGRVNSLYVRADMTDAATARMAYLQRPQIVLHSAPSDRTLRGTAQKLGIPSITLEIGNPHRFHPEFIKRSVTGLRAVLSDQGLIGRRQLSLGPSPVLCAKSSWIYTDHGGLLEVFPRVTERLNAGAPIARVSNIFGDVLSQYRAPHAGIVIGKSVQPVGETGARVLHLGVIADPTDSRFRPRELAG